jgi:hypothetical protein
MQQKCFEGQWTVCPWTFYYGNHRQKVQQDTSGCIYKEITHYCIYRIWWAEKVALNGKFICTMNLQLHQIWKISWVAEQLLHSQECLYSMVLAGNESACSDTGQTDACFLNWTAIHVSSMVVQCRKASIIQRRALQTQIKMSAFQVVGNHPRYPPGCTFLNSRVFKHTAYTEPMDTHQCWVSIINHHCPSITFTSKWTVRCSVIMLCGLGWKFTVSSFPELKCTYMCHICRTYLQNLWWIMTNLSLVRF